MDVEESFRKKVKSTLRVPHHWFRDGLAEFLGTFILVTIGNGSVAQHVLGKGDFGGFLGVNWAWCIAVAMGVWVSGGVTGGHINPAASVAMCILGRTKWIRLPVYMLAQYLGAFVASACVYGVYLDALNDFDGGNRTVIGPTATAGIWATYPKDFLSWGGGLADQVLATALLVCLVLAVTDDNNQKPHKGMVPLCVGLIVAGIGMSFGYNCGYAINPARDLGPRIFTAMAGWGSECFTAYNHFFWIPIVGPHIGAILGAWTYQICIGVHWPVDDEYDINVDSTLETTLDHSHEMKGVSNHGFQGEETRQNKSGYI